MQTLQQSGVFGLKAICIEDMCDRSMWNFVSDYTTHELRFVDLFLLCINILGLSLEL